MLCFPLFLRAQTKITRQIAFYNVENLFDTLNDPLTHDNEFLPNRKKQWDSTKYYTKLHHLSRVILALNNWEGPDVLGLAEVENEQVLLDLITKTNLKKYNYSIIHHDSPDPRGIDVAVLYKTQSFNPTRVDAIPVVLKTIEGEAFTRSILKVDGELKGYGDITLYVNHWSSRRNGKAETDYKRMRASETLISYIKKEHVETDKIIITGDFNDGPTDESILSLEKSLGLRNWMSANQRSLKYQQTWYVFDQILTSANISLDVQTSGVFNPSWLMVEDIYYGGFKPKRTYEGFNYTGGYSDHFPVYMTLGY